MRKVLIASFMACLILVTIIFTVVTANEISIEKEKLKENDPSSGSWNKGIVLFHTVHYDFMMPETYYPDPWRLLTCEDLDTGEIRYITTNWLGFRVRFFPRGHNYKIHLEGTTLDIIIEDLKFYNYARFETPMPINRLIISMN